MKKHIEKLLKMIPGELKGTTTSSAKKDMFDLNNMSKKLNQKSADLFHSVVATVLWITMRGRPDLETAELFLCKRVVDLI